MTELAIASGTAGHDAARSRAARRAGLTTSCDDRAKGLTLTDRSEGRLPQARSN